MTSRKHTVACLAGDGVGPELMAAACRALAAVARAHSFDLMDVHLPIGREALLRYGHPLPSTTRNGYRNVDAILAATPEDPALDGVRADLELCWGVTRVPLGEGVLVVGPLGAECRIVAAARAVEIACARRGRLVAVGAAQDWADAVDVEAAARPGVDVEHLSLGEMLTVLRDDPGRLDVVAADEQLHGPLNDAIVRLADAGTGLACGWLPEHGPGLFAPAAVDPSDAGFGVADPTAIFYAAALLLSEGLGRRSAARTLERAVTALRGTGGDTLGNADAVVESLADTRTDTEFFVEVRA